MDSQTMWQKLQLLAGRSRLPPPRPTLLALTGLASLFAVLTVSDCSFMISARSNSDETRVGLFSQTTYDFDGRKLGCLPYPDRNLFDGMFRAGRAFGAITSMLILTAFVCMATSLVWCPPQYHERLWSSSKYILVSATVTQMFAFFALGSNFMCTEHDCQLAGVGTLATFNVLLLAGVSIGIHFTAPPIVPWITWWQPPAATIGEDLHLTGFDPEVVHYIYRQRRQRADTEEGKPSVGPSTNVGVTVIDQYPTEEEPPPLLAGPQPDGSFSDLETEHSWIHPGDASSEANSSQSTSMGLQDLTSFRVILLSLFLFAWAVCIAGVSRCSFLMVGPVGEDISHYRGIGLFTRAIYFEGNVLGCLEYPDQLKSQMDPVFLASRAFGTITALLMTVVLILVILQFFLDRAKDEVWFLVRLMLLCSTMFQFLVFSVFKTGTCHASDQVDCIPGQLGIWMILNVILMTILSVLVVAMPPPPHPLFALYQPNGNVADEGTDSHPEPVSLTSARQQNASHIVEPKSLKLLRLHHKMSTNEKVVTTNSLAEEDATAVLSDDGHERIVRIDPLMTIATVHGSFEEPLPPAQWITVTVEYMGCQKRVVKTLTHPDGSQTITTTIEELGSTNNEGETDCSILNDDDVDSEDENNNSFEKGAVDDIEEEAEDQYYQPHVALPQKQVVRDVQIDLAKQHTNRRIRPSNSVHEVKEIVFVRDQDEDGITIDWGATTNSAGDRGDTDGDGSLTVETSLVDDKEYYSDTA